MRGTKENLTGKVFGRLTVIEITDKRTDQSIVWKCMCVCGKEHFVNTKRLNKGSVKSCGCLMHDSSNKSRNFKGEDLTGKIFGKLKVIEYSYSDKFQHRKWKCKCECGNISYPDTGQLNSGKCLSCGCMSYNSGNRKGALVYNYSGYEDITGTKWNSIRSNAKTRQLDFFITKEDVWEVLIKQNNLCALSNLPISFKDKTASVDRIDSKRHYTLDNIQIVHKDVNRIKSDLELSYFLYLCKAISNK